MPVVMPGDPLWWLYKLNCELKDRQATMLEMDRYYYGDHPLPFLTRAHQAKMRDEFRLLLEDSRSNFMRMVVDATEERLKVEGFRLSASSDAVADQESWRIWQANDLDSESQTAFIESLVKGVSYLSVWGDGENTTIAVEDPLQTIIGYEPGSNFKRRSAALKVWEDDFNGVYRANVYMPDGIYKFFAKEAMPTHVNKAVPAELAALGAIRVDGWTELPDEFTENPLGIVPIVPLRNRGRLLVEGESELSDVKRIQNQINGFLFLLALAGHFGAHRQRWVSGITLHEDSKGRPVEPFKAATDQVWISEDPQVKFGEFTETNLQGYIAAIEQKVRHIAVTTRTPRHYLEAEGQSPSGDAIKSAESGLIKKVERKQASFSDGLEEAIRLARLFAGETDLPTDSEVVWGDPTTRTEAEITDATLKKFQAKLIPWEQACEDLGYTQTQITKMLGMFGGAAPEPMTDNTTPA